MVDEDFKFTSNEIREIGDDFFLMKDIEKWKELFFKLPKILTYFVLFMIPFSGLVLDSFNIGGMSLEVVYGLCIIIMILSLVTRQWKYFFIAPIGSLLMFSITLGLSEFLWWFLLENFDIDISYR